MSTPADPIDPLPPAPTVTVTADGPYVVTGEVEIRTEDGLLVRTAREVAFCRCGQSADKPYCDGSHERTGWRDQGPVSHSAPAADGAA